MLSILTMSTLPGKAPVLPYELPGVDSRGCATSLQSRPKCQIAPVHDDGEIWSAAQWQIRGALGYLKADTLIVQHHFLLARDSSFNAAAKALVTAAKSLGFSSTEVGNVSNILTARGFTLTAP